MSEEEQEERSKYQTFLIFGAPGSGKGTQGRILGQTPRFYHCACGDVFRSLDTRTDIGQEFTTNLYLYSQISKHEQPVIRNHNKDMTVSLQIGSY